MKIIFVTDTLASGGAERVISVLSNNLCQNFDNVEIICLRKKMVFYDINPEIKIVFADEYSSNWISKLFWLRNYIKKEDVTIAFMIRVYCVVLLSLFGLKRKIITSERNDPRFVPLKWKILRSLLLFTTTKHVVQTEKIKSYFPRRFQNKIIVINNPINIKQCGDKDWNSERTSILSIARLDKQKNIPMMLKAFLKFHEEYPMYILNIWGNRGYDEQNDEITKFIQQNNASQFIKLNGRCNDVAKEYDKAYMFLVTSNFEGFSNSMMEAVCSGVPTISTRVSGATELIKNEKNGLLIDFNDSEQLYKKMVYLIENPGIAKSLSLEGKKTRKYFEESVICKKWFDLIVSIY